VGSARAGTNHADGWGLGVVVALLPTAIGQAYDTTTGLPARSLDLLPFGLSSGEGVSVSELAANTLKFVAGGYLLAATWRLDAWRAMAGGRHRCGHRNRIPQTTP
jgi:hypothetical protein